MKTLFKLFCIAACVLFLCPTCKKNELDNNDTPERDPNIIVGGSVDLSYTNTTASYYSSSFLRSDSIYNFNRIEGVYSSTWICDMNIFSLRLTDLDLTSFNRMEFVQVCHFFIYYSDLF
jgi:hypothetical protein